MLSKLDMEDLMPGDVLKITADQSSFKGQLVTVVSFDNAGEIWCNYRKGAQYTTGRFFAHELSHDPPHTLPDAISKLRAKYDLQSL